MQNNYYWTDNWSEEFYVQLAKAGFISTTYDTKDGLVLLPELQFSYAILDFQNLHISKKVKKLLQKDNYTFTIDSKLDEILEKISTQHKDNWLKEKYIKLLKNLHKNKDMQNFQVISVELSSKKTNQLIAGEVGYIIGKTYTSLSGFSLKEKEFNNYGTLQLVLLAKYLEKQNFSFWNLGHPFMEYKKKLGAEIVTRDRFLQRWNKEINEFYN